MMQTKLVKSVKDFSIEGLKMPMIVIYDSPSDFPDKVLARLWDLDKPTEFAIAKDSISEIRKSIKIAERWVHCLPRMAKDDPKIVEVWL
jgi:hypothetical protein